MNKLWRMNLVLEMDRPIDPDEHYISPGGYEINGKPFDFYRYEGSVDKDNPCILNCCLREFDGTLGDEDEEIVITEKDIKKGFGEFYVFTGEYNDPEINVKEVKEIVFEMYDAEVDEISFIAASDEILKSANDSLSK